MRRPSLPILLFALVVLGLAALLAAWGLTRKGAPGEELGFAVAGEARQGGLSLALAPAVAARSPPRPPAGPARLLLCLDEPGRIPLP